MNLRRHIRRRKHQMVAAVLAAPKFYLWAGDIWFDEVTEISGKALAELGTTLRTGEIGRVDGFSVYVSPAVEAA